MTDSTIEFSGGRQHIEGRSITPGEIGAIKALPAYHKIGHVHARELTTPATVATPEGDMTAEPGDYLVFDCPPTHCWPVKKEVFERTYNKGPSAIVPGAS